MLLDSSCTAASPPSSICPCAPPPPQPDLHHRHHHHHHLTALGLRVLLTFSWFFVYISLSFLLPFSACYCSCTSQSTAPPRPTEPDIRLRPALQQSRLLPHSLALGIASFTSRPPFCLHQNTAVNHPYWPPKSSQVSLYPRVTRFLFLPSMSIFCLQMENHSPWHPVIF